MMPWEKPDDIPACIRRDANNRAPFMDDGKPPFGLGKAALNPAASLPAPGQTKPLPWLARS
jgi:hypothetical protein